MAADSTAIFPVRFAEPVLPAVSYGYSRVEPDAIIKMDNENPIV